MDEEGRVVTGVNGERVVLYNDGSVSISGGGLWGQPPEDWWDWVQQRWPGMDILEIKECSQELQEAFYSEHKKSAEFQKRTSVAPLEYLKKSFNIYLCVDANDTLLGYMITGTNKFINPPPEYENMSGLHILDLWVVESQRRKGYGSFMMRYLRYFIKGIAMITWDSANNPEVIAFYEKLRGGVTRIDKIEWSLSPSVYSLMESSRD
jgi:ribosomal protein S18 acetylase RimI-like enzyme